MFKCKSPLLKILVIVISLMLILVGCSSDTETGSDSDGGKSSVKKSKVEVNFDEPEKAIEQTVVSTIVDSLSSYVENSKNFDYDNMSFDAKLSVTLGSEFGSFVDSVSDMSGAGQIFESVGLDSASVSAKLDRNSDKFALDMDAYVNNKKIVGGNAILSLDDEMVYLSVPDLAKGTVGVDGSDFMGELQECFEMIDYSAELESSLLTSLSSALDEDELSELLTAYAECVIESLGEPESGKADIEAGDVSKKVDYIKYTLDDETVRELLTSVFEKVKNDTALRSMFVQLFPSFMDVYEQMLSLSSPYGYSNYLGSVSAEDLFDETFIPTIEEALEEMDELDFDEVYSVSVYYGDNKLIGFSFNDDDGEEYLSYICITNGNKVGLELSSAGMTVLSFDGTVSSGKYSGTLSIGPSYETISLEIYDFDLDKLVNKGELHITVVVPSELFEQFASDSTLPSGFNLKISLDSNANSANVAVEALNGTKSIIEAKLDLSFNDKASRISVPSNYISAESEDDMYDWANELQTNVYSVLLGNLSNAGLDLEFLTSLASLG